MSSNKKCDVLLERRAFVYLYIRHSAANSFPLVSQGEQQCAACSFDRL